MKSEREFPVFIVFVVSLANQCGIKPPGNRIVGGEEADRNEYPWQVMMRIKKGDLDLQFCGGSLISPDTVLTAAHCVNLPNGLADYIYVRYRTTEDVQCKLINFDVSNATAKSHWSPSERSVLI